jgi:penicillin-binding protein 2
MAELKNLELELRRFRARVFVAAVFVLLGLAVLGARMVHLQVVQHDQLAARAENNRIAVLPLPPNRGRIVDRHGVVLADTYSAYTLEITPARAGDVEATIAALAEVVDIRPGDRRRFARLREEGKSFDSIPIRTRLSDDEVARFAAQRWRFPGVEVNARLFRHYPLGATGAHLIGHIGRINAAQRAAMADWDDAARANYRGTEHIGKLGLEQSYEAVLHGTTGYAAVEITAGGRAVRQLRSQPPVPGDGLLLAVDIRLQALVEQLFGERRGALVAIDPRNGEVLAFVSKPTFDPNLFVDGIGHEAWRELNEDPDRPLLNRALRGTYPPGSTYKPFMALAALTSGTRRPQTVIQDTGTFVFGGHRFRSHGDRALGPVDLRRSLVHSSNVYYYSLAHEMGVDLMHEHLAPLGLGARTGIDLVGEATGVLPSREWKRRAFRRPEQQRWHPGDTISLGIGQGYNSFTILQLAQAMAVLASGGQRFEPRLVREIEDSVSGERRAVPRAPRPPLAVDAQQVRVIVEAMHDTTVEGTPRRVFAGAAYRSGGKTGTAQAVGIAQGQRYDAARVAEHLRNHSLYVAFAPVEAPTIALAVIVENAGFGAAAAAPIARRVFDYWLLGLYPSEEDIALTREGRSAAPVGTPRRAADVPLPGAAPAPAELAVAPPGRGERLALHGAAPQPEVRP